METTTTTTVSYIDSHAHIQRIFQKDKIEIANYPEFLKNSICAVAEKQGTKYEGCVNVCCGKEYYDDGEKLLAFEGIFPAWGVHPHSAKDWDADMEKRFRALLAHPKTVAIGEMGLDYFYNNSDPAVQRDVFKTQINIAKETKLPIIIHSRDAAEDTWTIMTEYIPADWKIHFHCFSYEDTEYAAKLLKAFPNLFIGFTGALTFKKSDKLREVIKSVPLQRLLLETDSPYMAPEPYRSKTCHPGYIPFIAKRVAEVHGTTTEEVLKITRQNVNKVYGI